MYCDIFYSIQYKHNLKLFLKPQRHIGFVLIVALLFLVGFRPTRVDSPEPFVAQVFVVFASYEVDPEL